MILPSDLRSVFAQHLSKLELKFAHYFQEDLSSYEWIQDPYAQPIPSSFTEKEKEDYIDLACDSSLKRKFNSVNLTIQFNSSLFHYTYVSRIRKQETAKRPCGHQSRLHLVAIYLKILKVINLVMTYDKQNKNKHKQKSTNRLDRYSWTIR